MENATKKGEQKHEKAGPKVRLRWDSVVSFGQRFEANTGVGIHLWVIVTKNHPTEWTSFVDVGMRSKPEYCKTFATKLEAMVYCELVAKSLVVADLGILMGEDWTHEPNRFRIRMVCDVEYVRNGEQYLLQSRDVRNCEEFIIVTGLHDDRCAERKGKPCNCPSAALTGTNEAVGHA